MPKQLRCYACRRPAITTEHSPPQCIFPPADLVGGQNLRYNLITVPSCDRHNSRKSSDDLYFAWILAIGSPSEELREARIFRIKRIIEERKHAGFLKSQREKFLQRPEEKTLLIEYDHRRMVRFLKSLAQGIYFHERGKRLTRNLNTLCCQLVGSDRKPNEFVIGVKNQGGKLLETLPWNGDNQTVFKYKFHENTDGGVVMLFNFYGSIDFFVATSQKT